MLYGYKKTNIKHMLKRTILTLTTLLVSSTTLATIPTKPVEIKETSNIVITPSIAYRYDVFKWSIPSDRFLQNKLSELVWKSQIIQPSIKLELEPQTNQLTISGQVKYGYILKNNSKSWDLDWFGNHRYDQPFSKTLSSVKGNILDLSGAVGYSLGLFKQNLLTFYVGYDYNDYKNNQYGIRQLANNQNKLQYPFNKLVSKYYFKTQSPWIGLSLKTTLNDKFSIIPTIKYYSFKYTGRGYWVLCNDLQQNPSFKHTAKGKGLGFNVDFLYKYSDNLNFKIGLETKMFKMKHGNKKIFFTEETKKSPLYRMGGDTPKTGKIYDLSLISSSISVGLKYKL
jgi:hypothetical protein